MADNKLSDHELKEIRKLYLAGATEEPSAHLDADILTLSRQSLKDNQIASTDSADVSMGKDKAESKGPGQRKFSPWVWSSAASVVLIVGLSLYWPELQGPAVDAPVMQPEPMMMRSSAPPQASPASAEASQKMAVNSAEQAAPLSATSALGDQVMIEQSPAAAVGVAAKSLPQSSGQTMATLSVRDDKVELARSLDKLAELIKAGELASASLEYQTLAPQVSQLPKEDPMRIRYQQLGEMLNR